MDAGLNQNNFYNATVYYEYTANHKHTFVTYTYTYTNFMYGAWRKSNEV